MFIQPSQVDYPEHYQHIFLLSHMRANTSLISHILGSHAQISGYYEMHLSYCSAQDLVRQQQMYLTNDSIEKNTKYLFDKLLHNDYKLYLDNLGTRNPQVLVSIRSAEQTIKSIVNLFRNKSGQRTYANIESATQYYIDRISTLVKFCEMNKSKYYYFDAELIRIDSEKILNYLQTWLSLDVALNDQYQMFSMTGKTRAGDSSENMTQGKIVQQNSNYDEIEIPDDLLQNAITKSQQAKQLIIAGAIEAITV